MASFLIQIDIYNIIALESALVVYSKSILIYNHSRGSFLLLWVGWMCLPSYIEYSALSRSQLGIVRSVIECR